MFRCSLYTDRWHHLHSSPTAVTAARNAVSISQNTTDWTRDLLPRLRHRVFSVRTAHRQCDCSKALGSSWLEISAQKLWQHSVYICCTALNPERTTNVRRAHVHTAIPTAVHTTGVTARRHTHETAATAQHNYVHMCTLRTPNFTHICQDISAVRCKLFPEPH